MRLIDADDLRWTTLKDGFGRINTCIVFESDINAMSTIEAIPVEWIEMWFEKALRSANDGDDVTVDVMLDDWRKENETD